MIRVVYEWRVKPDDITEFREAWKQTTNSIHESVEGARGSFLLQAVEDPGKILTIARWDSVKHWQAFWQSENPPEMRRMSALGKRISATAYDEFGDYTV